MNKTSIKNRSFFYYYVIISFKEVFYMDKKTKDKINEVLEKDKGFIKDNNYSIVSLDDDLVVMEAIIGESSLNPYKIAHGGFIFGLADTCGGLLVSTTGRIAVTTNAYVNYFHKAVGKKLVAKSKFLKKGKLLSNVEVDIYDDKDSLVSTVLFEYCYIEEKI